MAEPSVAGELLKAIAARDSTRIAACFAPAATLEVLTPKRLRRETGPDEIAARYGQWFGRFEGFALLDSDVEDVADHVRIRYRIHGRHPEHGWQMNEHAAYARVEQGRIAVLRLVCTGFRPTPPPPS